MTPESLHAVAYVSSATHHLNSHELDALLTDARNFNEDVGVTGALLYHDGSFFQYFEGPQPGVYEVYERIKKSRTHHGLIELVAGPVEERHFTSWSMGFAEPVASDLQALSHADWLDQREEALHQTSSSSGLSLLLSFWERAQGNRIEPKHDAT